MRDCEGLTGDGHRSGSLRGDLIRRHRKDDRAGAGAGRARGDGDETGIAGRRPRAARRRVDHHAAGSATGVEKLAGWRDRVIALLRQIDQSADAEVAGKVQAINQCEAAAGGNIRPLARRRGFIQAEWERSRRGSDSESDYEIAGVDRDARHGVGNELIERLHRRRSGLKRNAGDVAATARIRAGLDCE